MMIYVFHTLFQITHALRTRGNPDFDEITVAVPWDSAALDCGQDVNADQVRGKREGQKERKRGRKGNRKKEKEREQLINYFFPNQGGQPKTL